MSDKTDFPGQGKGLDKHDDKEHGHDKDKEHGHDKPKPRPSHNPLPYGA